MILQDKKIAIVGGGPGGLTLANLLAIKGANVKVYERDVNKDVRVQGATLDLHEESGLEALRRAGLLNAFYANYRPDAGKLRILDKEGNIKMDNHTADDFGEHRPEIDRGPLRRILLDALPDEAIVWDSHFLWMEQQGEGWLLYFKNGTSAYADIVIAADGANSKIRPNINNIKPIYSGITAVEGNLYNAAIHAPKLYDLVKGGKIFAFGDEQSLILSAKGDGSLSFYTGCKVPENWVTESGIDFTDKAQVFAWFKDAFGSWDSQWQELFASDELWFVPRPMYHYPLDQYWGTLPNLTMLGDAAHRMPPYAGEGVNMAMQDAYELADCLTSDDFHSVKEAIASYEKQMLKRASAVTQMTLDSTEMLHSEGAIEKMLRMFEGVREME
ncbi:NAD(P)/FAD-dependent oxidoreductase [Emticicia sp. BO119]|uniref:FAD-dependent oxidoreductase n=1 Tax=Emticicia sp. BO119 TaxID=2757768 RepID=UPI0015F0BD89|nr:NAD(P)/FAD-dependent oxidoreductase [Emticicia sp. BO119]MBA4852725.1 FAD-dependent monooxygenase [Emticicia sp. BO119]